MAESAAVSAPAVTVKNKGLLTAAIMVAVVMQVLDTTIANVALPHMRASLGASQDEINWVLTSYIVASAIATPLTGWVADRLGRRRLLLGAVVGFTVASLLCGVAANLTQMVLFRIVQGVCGAMLVPLAQATMMDINPREKLGQAMAIFGAGIMFGPIIGPTLGGWLTETFNWRAVFLVNLPVGILAFVMLFALMPDTIIKIRKFDFFGFGMLALAVASLQMLLDRGQGLDWFEAPEIWLYLLLTLSGLWVFTIHCLTAENPFIDVRMFRDRNFVTGLVLILATGITLFSGFALLPPMLQNLMGFPVVETGILMGPRGIGTMVSMIVVGRLVSKYDPRILIVGGTLLMGYSLYMMTQFDIVMSTGPILLSGFLQGVGMGFVFVPLNSLAFATIDQKYRVDATSMFSLVRNVGQGVGISLVTTVLAQMQVVNYGELASRLTLDAGPLRDFAASHGGFANVASWLSGLITQQAAMLAFLDDFWMMMVVTFASLPIVFLLRRPSRSEKPDPAHMMSE
ncbi:DHA2 family efflux MFS transporter permease subunit [Devosia rhizoryzae]|uniref:DHA2 family efflux MFS transporter permease subunit n=1 Tax=Devosia rhizoryzae TaxID=2774137 RepID=A0ABX7C5H3_9HYPH|nr:DHA2 family efflux MFS transporter permease subunit [Devosia rhizoryzae]QQR38519.1 DHA2 family efflux MFS transporter permease subunit [Devosia rhizoryzae]